MNRYTVIGGLLVAIALAIAARSLNLPVVFVDGDVYLTMWDGSYHARRALYSFLAFPKILFFDTYLAFPDGAPVPMPPLYDWLLAAVARLFGDDVPTFERAVAWWSPAVAALTLIPIYRTGRLLDRPGAGLAAALLFAALPATSVFSQVGDPDHHASVGLLVLLYAAGSALLVHPTTRGGRFVAAGIALAVVRAVLMLTWSGSLLYLAVGEGVLLVVAALAARPALFGAQALGVLGAAAAAIPWLVATPAPIGGPLSATTLSWLHVLALTCVALTAGGLAVLERSRPTRTSTARLARAARGENIVEQSSLFPWMPGGRGNYAGRLFGGFAYAIPLAPLAYLWCGRSREDAGPRLALAIWTAALSVLVILQVRFASDFAPLGCLGFALLLDALRRRLLTPIRALPAFAVALALALALLAPTLTSTRRARVGNLVGYLGGAEQLSDPVFARAGPTLVRFAKLVRSVTPETSGFLDPAQQPEYSILARASFGHAMHYAARRPTPADGFGPYLDEEKTRLVQRFYTARGEAQARRIAARLRARYVLSFDNHTLRPGQFLHRLHRLDGSKGKGAVHLEHFRLVAEAPWGAKPLLSSFPDGLSNPVIPYKLFRRVKGAVVEAHAPEGTPFELELKLRSNTGRSFRFQAETRADASGTARLRVPYDTEGDEPTRALGPYRARLGDRELELSLRAADVLEGAVVPLE
jgi:asparagine N-glycosylation enzyme membrane subunit Stt3